MVQKIQQFGENLELKIKEIEESLKTTQGSLKEILINLVSKNVNNDESLDKAEPTFFEIIANKELNDLKLENANLKKALESKDQLLKKLQIEVKDIINDLQNL